MPAVTYILPVSLIITIVFISVKAGKLTLTGGIMGGFIAIAIFAGAGYTGIAMLGTFFILGTLATGWKKREKQQFKESGDRATRRNAGQVFANGGAAAIAAILSLLLPAQKELFILMMAASLASATADTLSSELGMVYGRRFYNIITLKRDLKGLDGVISLEGTLIGITGALLIAVIYACEFGRGNAVWFIVLAGTIGNLSDSVLGALLERKKYLTNDMVNFINTLIAALAVWLLVSI